MNTAIRSVWHSVDLAIAGVGLVLLVLLTLLGVVMRYYFNAPLAWLEEIQMMSIIWLTFFGGSAAFRLKGHVAIELLMDLCSPAIRRGMGMLVFCVVLGVLGFLTWQGCLLVTKFYQSGRATSILGLPYELVYGAIPLGSLLMLCNFVRTEFRSTFFAATPGKGTAA